MTSKTTAPEPETRTDDDAPESLKFEDAVERLEEIVRRMEEDQMPLEQLIGDYETGTRLLGVCRSRIDNARSRIEQIGRTLDDGTVALEDFEPGSEDAPGGKNIRLQ